MNNKKNITNFSVLMSVYALEKAENLRQSLESIYAQSLKADECVIVQDGPLGDELLLIIAEYRKLLPIVSVSLKENKGLAKALNIGLKHCSYDFIIRMDSDDICLNDRFESQVTFMVSNPHISVSSGVIEEYNDSMTELLHTRRLPTEHSEILRFAKTRSPISHPATIYRKKDVLSVGGYPALYPEDYALWIIMIHQGFKFANLSKSLLKFRGGDLMIARRGPKFLKGYIQTYKLMYRLNFISLLELISNVLKQSLLRLSPVFIRRLLYKHARS